MLTLLLLFFATENFSFIVSEISLKMLTAFMLMMSFFTCGSIIKVHELCNSTMGNDISFKFNVN